VRGPICGHIGLPTVVRCCLSHTFVPKTFLRQAEVDELTRMDSLCLRLASRRGNMSIRHGWLTRTNYIRTAPSTDLNAASRRRMDCP
jgi:hypothetical protein